MPCNLATTQAAACTSGIGKLTDPVHLLQVIAELSCELAAAGGGSQTPWTQNINAAGFGISNLGTINGVKVYRAMVTQAGTAAPVATVLENTLGGTVVWTRLGPGLYAATLAGAFTVSKTFCQSSSVYDAANGYVAFSALSRNSANELRMVTTSPGVDLTTSSDDVDASGLGFAVEIRVFT